MKPNKLNPDITAKDLMDFVRSNINTFQREFDVCHAKWHNLTRTERALKHTSYSMLHEYEVQGNKFWMLRCFDKNKQNSGLYGFADIALVEVGTNKYHYFDFHRDGNVMVLTTHFFERYALRGRKKGDTKKIVRQWYKNNTVNIRIYDNEKNGHCVWACEDGLILGLLDKDRNLSIACTFVDYSLLKPSQRAAFNTIYPEIGKLVTESSDLCTKGYRNTNTRELILSYKHKDVRDVAEEIYSLYFESGDLRERNRNNG